MSLDRAEPTSSALSVIDVNASPRGLGADQKSDKVRLALEESVHFALGLIEAERFEIRPLFSPTQLSTRRRCRDRPTKCSSSAGSASVASVSIIFHATPTFAERTLRSPAFQDGLIRIHEHGPGCGPGTQRARREQFLQQCRGKNADNRLGCSVFDRGEAITIRPLRTHRRPPMRSVFCSDLVADRQRDRRPPASSRPVLLEHLGSFLP